MAFTNAQRVKVRALLGYPQVFHAANPRLEAAISVVGNDVDAQAEAVVVLAGIVNVDTAIAGAYSRAGVKKVDEIEFFASDAGNVVLVQRKYGRQLISRLSMLFGVEIVGDYYGEAGYQGDEWSHRENQYGGEMNLG